MTMEEQRYYEECRKNLNSDQLGVVGMAIDYGLQLSDIRKVVQSNKKDAACMREIMQALMENASDEVVDFLCENDFNQYQIKEIIEAILNGLTFEQVRSYATKEMSANRMRKMRKQLENTIHDEQNSRIKEDEGVRGYMKGLMEIMEDSIMQFKESNERFDALSALVKDHVVEEKNREIQDLYEDLKDKEKSIQDLKTKLSDREKRINDLEAELGKLRKPGLVVEDASVKNAGKAEQMDVQTEQSRKKRMLTWFAARTKNIPIDIFGKIMEKDLSPEQLEEIRQCLESGLDDKEITRVIENNPSPERMKKMREILLLMKQRKAGA